MVTTSPSGYRLVIRRNGKQRHPFGTTPILPWKAAGAISNMDGTFSPWVVFELEDGIEYQYVLPAGTIDDSIEFQDGLAGVSPLPTPPYYGGYYWNLSWPFFVVDKRLYL